MPTSTLFPRFCIVALSLFIASRAGSETLYDNGAPNHFPLPDGFEMTQWIEADDFMLTTPARVESITFWDIELFGSFDGTIVWRIYSNAPNNTPGTLLYSGSATASHVGTGFATLPYTEYAVSFDITPVVLPAGVYWLGLHNGPLSNYVNQRVYWESTGTAGARESQSDIGPFFAGLWSSNSVPAGAPSDFAFQLKGVAVPRVIAIGRNAGHPQISFTTTAGYNYRVEYKNSLNDRAWTAVSGAEQFGGNGSVMQVADPDPATANQSRRFYRVVLL